MSRVKKSAKSFGVNEMFFRPVDVDSFREFVDVGGVGSRAVEAAKAAGHSNCPLCALEATANNTRIWALSEMDADHVTAWSRGGATDIANCQMLCKTHNRAKGNK
jgi:hypothetical protein